MTFDPLLMLGISVAHRSAGIGAQGSVILRRAAAAASPHWTSTNISAPLGRMLCRALRHDLRSPVEIGNIGSPHRSAGSGARRSVILRRAAAALALINLSTNIFAPLGLMLCRALRYNLRSAVEIGNIGSPHRSAGSGARRSVILRRAAAAPALINLSTNISAPLGLMLCRALRYDLRSPVEIGDIGSPFFYRKRSPGERDIAPRCGCPQP
jgi:hypothetical protein